MSRSTWIVWLAEHRAEVLARDVDGAIEDAEWLRDHDGVPLRNPFVSAASQMSGTIERALAPCMLFQPEPVALSCSRVVRYIGEREVIVEDTPEAYRVGLLALERACLEWVSARKVFDDLPRVYVDRFRSGMRNGQPRWPTTWSDEARRRVTDQLVAIDEAQARVDATIDSVHAALAVLDDTWQGHRSSCPELVVKTNHLGPADLVVTLHDVVTRVVSLVADFAHRVTDSRLAVGTTLAWLREHEEHLAQEVERCESISTYGFAPGSHATLLPSSCPENPSGPCTVLTALVHHRAPQHGEESRTEHARLVACKGREYEIRVEELTPAWL